jgi:putative sterol carrier protein
MTTDVPETPGAFFSEYIPRRFDAMKGGLAGKTSAGSMVFRVLDAGEWNLRLLNGELKIGSGMPDDVVLQISVAQRDFKPIFVHGAELQEDEPLRPDQQILAFKVLTVDAERMALVRGVRGNVAFSIKSGGETHTIIVTPGAAKPNFEQPDCRLECLISDFIDMQTGKRNPVELAMAGKVRIIGNAQIPLALSSVFA